MPLTPDTDFGHHPSMTSLCPLATLQSLILAPETIIRPLEADPANTSGYLKMAALFWVATSLLFGLTSILHQPPEAHWEASALAARFGAMTLACGLLAIPILIILWGMFHKFSSWFWDGQLTYRSALTLSGLGTGYYALMFLLSIPLLLLPGLPPMVMEMGLFSLNVVAFVLSLRLFFTFYRVTSGFSVKKSLLVSTFPLLMAGVVYGLTQLLTYFAMAPHLRGSAPQ